jgi:hypothetical protein
MAAATGVNYGINPGPPARYRLYVEEQNSDGDHAYVRVRAWPTTSPFPDLPCMVSIGMKIFSVMERGGDFEAFSEYVEDGPIRSKMKTTQRD